jgi:hypothetical protein
MSEIKKASDIVGEVFGHIEKTEFEKVHTLHSCWRETAGEKIYAHSRITDLSRGILHIEVTHPGWIQLIQFRRREILRALKKRFPELDINSLVFHLTGPEGCSSGRNKPEETMTREKMLERIERDSPSGIYPEDGQSGAAKNDEKHEPDETLKALFSRLEKTMKEKG